VYQGFTEARREGGPAPPPPPYPPYPSTIGLGGSAGEGAMAYGNPPFPHENLFLEFIQPACVTPTVHPGVV